MTFPASVILGGICGLWFLHWVATCTGRNGQFSYYERTPLFGVRLKVPLGHHRSIFWASAGERIDIEYRVSMDAPGIADLRVGKWKPLWAADRYKYAGLVSLKGSGSTRYTYAVTKTGLHFIARGGLSSWVGRASVSWRVQ